MVRLSRSGFHAHEVDFIEDHTATASNQHAAIDANVSLGDKPFTVLQNHNTNIDQSSPDFIDSLTEKLKDLHIYSPKENRGDRSLLAAHQRPKRPFIVHENLTVLDPVGKETGNCDNRTAETTHAQGPFPAELPRLTKLNEGVPSLAETHASPEAATYQTPDTFEASFPSRVLRASHLDRHPLGTDPRTQLTIAKHKAATSLGTEDVITQDTLQQTFVPEDEEIMAVAEPIGQLISPTSAGDEPMPNKSSQSGVTVTVVEQAQPEPQDALTTDLEHREDRSISFSTDDASVEAPRTPSRSTSASSRSRIEDSVEALDRLEEQLEAVDAAITPPSKSRRHQTAVDESSVTKQNDGLQRTSSLLKRGQADRATPSTVQARGTLRKSVSIATANQGEGSPAKSATKRSSVSRPTSLLPPKPPARSTKPPTKPSFELPGEAVARRIKEQREARLAQQAEAAAAAAASVVPQRTRSIKAPTRPNFELPGEAISRRKRAEREAKLKAQEEEERKRREFKARPIRANLTSASYPRETATSRARQSKGPELDEVGQVGQNASKRSSILGTPRAPLTRSGSTRTPQVRGRVISQASSPQPDRAASISASSVSSKRSTLSAEDLEQQKIKGRAVFERDNCYVEDKERERRERELNTKLAREQAAERSRQASREWADKQRRKQLLVANAIAA